MPESPGQQFPSLPFPSFPFPSLPFPWRFPYKLKNHFEDLKMAGLLGPLDWNTGLVSWAARLEQVAMVNLSCPFLQPPSHLCRPHTEN